MANALPLLVLAGGAALLLKKKKKATKKSPPITGDTCGSWAPNFYDGKLSGVWVDDGQGGCKLRCQPGYTLSEDGKSCVPARAEPTPPGPAPTPVPGDQVEPGKIEFTGSTSTKNYGIINWRVRLYDGGPMFYVEVLDPDDQEFEVVTTNKVENGPVLLFASIEDAKQWMTAFINGADEGKGVLPPQPPQPKPERGEAYNLKPGTYANVGSYSRYGLLLPYRTPKTTVSVRRKSGLVWYPAKQTEARFVGWNSKNPEEAFVEIDVKGEYSIIALDGGPNGVFIAEWILKATQD